MSDALEPDDLHIQIFHRNRTFVRLSTDGESWINWGSFAFPHDAVEPVCDEVARRLLPADNPDSVKLDGPEREALALIEEINGRDFTTRDVYYGDSPADLIDKLGALSPGARAEFITFVFREDDLPDSVKSNELADLEAEFEAAGGRGVELADRIDALRAEVAIEQAVAGMPEHPRIERSGTADAPWWVWIPPRGPQDFDADEWSILGPYGGTYWPTFDEAVEFMRRTLDSATCKHCGRTITRENGAWVDPEATGDDAVWRETCDAHDTFTAEHEPAPETTTTAFNRLLNALDAARVDTDEPDGEQRYQDAREACFAFVDAHPEVLPLARDYGLPISPGELPTPDQAADALAEQLNPNWIYPLFATCKVCGEKLQFDIDPGGTPGQNGDWGADGDYGCITGDDEGCDGHTPVNIRWEPNRDGAPTP